MEAKKKAKDPEGSEAVGVGESCCCDGTRKHEGKIHSATHKAHLFTDSMSHPTHTGRIVKPRARSATHPTPDFVPSPLGEVSALQVKSVGGRVLMVWGGSPQTQTQPAIHTPFSRCLTTIHAHTHRVAWHPVPAATTFGITIITLLQASSFSFSSFFARRPPPCQ